MKKTTILAAPAAFALACLVLAADAKPEKPALDRFASLEGEWYELDEEGKATDNLVSRFRVTASGTAVLETVFPDTEKEMLTLYHMDGDDLVLTHYCMLGNQPRMRAVASEEGTTTFECEGGANIASEDDQHMHAASFARLGPDRLRTEWRMTEKGEVVYTVAFDLVRPAGD